MFSVILANTFILFAFAMFCFTVNRVYERVISRNNLFVMIPVHILLFVIFTYLYPDTYLRIIIISLEIIYLLLLSIIKMRKSRVLPKTAIFRMVIITQTGYILFLIFRIIDTSLFNYKIESIFNANMLTAVIFLSSITYHISMNLVIIITLNRQYELEALERVHLLKLTQQEISRINSMPFELNTVENGNELYNSISNFIMDYFGATGIGIHFLNSKSDELYLISLTENLSDIKEMIKILPIDEHYITGKAVICQQPVFIAMDQYPNKVLQKKLQELGVTEIASFPINSHFGTIGTFTMVFDSDAQLIKKNYDIFKLISIQIGSILENFELSKKLQREASTDLLTGIANRRDFLKRFGEEFSRAKRHKTSLSLLMIDIDYFKSVNDNFGHDAGDFVLKELARIIRNNLRTEDIFGRYGGEEFLILLVDCSLKEAAELAERYREKIESSELNFRSTPIRITISIGGTELIKDDHDTDVLITRSDNFLYEAKKSGRNRCVLK